MGEGLRGADDNPASLVGCLAASSEVRGACADVVGPAPRNRLQMPRATLIFTTMLKPLAASVAPILLILQFGCAPYRTLRDLRAEYGSSYSPSPAQLRRYHLHIQVLLYREGDTQPLQERMGLMGPYPPVPAVFSR